MKSPYKLADGSIAPGVTTICGVEDKGEGLISWSHKIAYESTVKLIRELQELYGELTIPKYEEIQKWQDVRDSAGDIGTLVHKLCIDFISGEEITLPDDEIVIKCFGKFMKWWDRETERGKLEIITETPLISEVYRFGGTPDIYIVNKKKRVDIKTSGGIYDSYWIQLAGYDILGRENGYPAKEHQIVWIPKHDGFDCPLRTDLRKEKEIFKHLLKIYQLRKEIEL